MAVDPGALTDGGGPRGLDLPTAMASTDQLRPVPNALQALLKFQQNYQQPATAHATYKVPDTLISQASNLFSSDLTSTQPTTAPGKPAQSVLDQVAGPIPGTTVGGIAGAAKGTLGLIGDIARGVKDQALVPRLQHLQRDPVGAMGDSLKWIFTNLPHDIGHGIYHSIPHPAGLDPEKGEAQIGPVAIGSIAQSVSDAAGATLNALDQKTDQANAQAIVAWGGAAFNFIGGKGLFRVASTRALLSKQLEEIGTTEIQPHQIVKVISGTRKHPVLGPLADQLESMPQHPEDIMAKIRAQGGDVNEKAQSWLNELQTPERWRQTIFDQIRAMPPGSDLTRLNMGLTGVEKMVAPIRMQLAEMYNFRPDPVSTVSPLNVSTAPLSEEEKAILTPETKKAVESGMSEFRGTARAYEEPFSTSTSDIEQAMEHAGKMVAAGTAHSDWLVMMNAARNALKALRINPDQHHDVMRRIEASLKDGSKFAALSGPEQAAARVMRNLEDYQQELQLKNNLQSGVHEGNISWVAERQLVADIESAYDPTRTWIDGMRGQQIAWPKIEQAGNAAETAASEQSKYATREEYEKALGPDYKVLPYFQGFQASWYKTLHQLEIGRVRQALMEHTIIPDEVLKPGYSRAGDVPLAEAGTRPDFWASMGTDPKNLPPTAVETMFKNDQEAGRLGYIKAVGGTGRTTDLNYQPAVYLRKDLGERWLHDMEQATTREHFQSAIMKALQTGSGWTKGLIMYSPGVHSGNLFGRILTQLEAEAGTGVPLLIKQQIAKFNDPEAYALAKARLRKNGGLLSYRHNLQQRQHWAESDGQPHAPGMKIARGAAVGLNWSQEHGVWRLADDLELFGSMLADARFEAAGITNSEVRGMMSASYGANLAGQTNPLYYGLGWKKWRSLLFFAPSWWASKMRTMLSVPLAATPLRITNLLVKKFPQLDPSQLKSLDGVQRREFMRMQRDHFMMSMSNYLMALDHLNVMFAGHHAWENPEGRMLDLCFDKYAQAEHPESNKSACMSLLPGLRQEADILSAMGVGHPWGLAHLPADQAFRQANAMDKAGMLVTAIIDGTRRLGAGRLSPQVNASISSLLGADAYNLITKSQIRPIDRREALLNFMPGGYLVQQAMQTQGQNWLGVVGGAALASSTGLPSIYEAGAERTNPVSEEKYQIWQQAQQKYAAEETDRSNRLMRGNLDFGQWKEQHITGGNALYQAQADAFGDTSPSGKLSKARNAIWKKYHLDQSGDTPEMHAARMDAFEHDWEQTIQHAPEAVKADYWNTERSHMTDADYLYWYAKQVDNAIMSVIDGQHGGLIRMQKARHAVASEAGLGQANLDAMTQQMPQYWLYLQYMKEIGQTSPLGAMVAAFRSPFSHALIAQSPEEAAQAEAMGLQGPIFQPSTIQGLEQQAKAAAGSPQAAQEAGQLGQDPAFQQQVGAGVK
jgi:hypothetical protein